MVDVDLRASGATGARLDALCDALVARMSTVAGVRAATYSWNGLFGGGEGWTSVRVDGLVPRTADDTTVHFDRVGPGYFRTIGARLLRGRGVESHDGSSAAKIGVVNATMARFYFGTQDPIGRFLRVEGTPVEVVGVVADVTDHDLRAESVRRLYLPLAQRADGGPGSVVFAVRVVGDPARAVAAVRGAVRDVDPTLRLYGVKPLTALMEESIAQDRIVARLASVAGSVALLLATLGLYGVVTYAIVRRRGEFGVRLALGARPADVTRLVLRESLRTFALGAALGVPLAMGLGRLVRHQLVGVGLVDVPITLGALAVVGVSALLAASIPARQAARLAPAAVLRDP
jgi:ABC-type antimicrobial peptide transport system permease subunit